jgi:hypothetical protein
LQLALVNIEWNAAFQHLVWRHQSFYHGVLHTDLFVNSDEYTRVILKKAALIERFYFRGCPNPATFLLFFSPGRNIRSFDWYLQYELPLDIFCLSDHHRVEPGISILIH